VAAVGADGPSFEVVGPVELKGVAVPVVIHRASGPEEARTGGPD
jgi:hypothetical protein